MTTIVPSGHSDVKYKIHWHVILTHFPVSLFMVSAGFMILHLFTNDPGYEKSAYLTLVAGAITMLPTTLTGWFTWKGRYKGARVKMFIYKSRIAYAMTFISITLVILRSFVFTPGAERLIWHYLYGFLVISLILGAVVEGYYGQRLNHR
jgi:uncharacterized membrane protein